MRQWPYKAIDEVCDVNPKQNGAERLAPNTTVSFVPMSAVDETFGEIIGTETRRLEDIGSSYTPFCENDVLFAKITPCMENGKTAIARHLENGIGYGSTEFHVLRSKKYVMPEWVFAFVRQPAFREQAKASFTGTAGQQRVPTDFLKQTLLPVPPMQEQERIVRILDEADQLRRLRAEADRHTGGLIPAMFYEMFSGAIANRLSYPRHSLEEVCISPAGIKAGPFGSSLKKESYTNQGPRVYGQEQIIAGDFSIGDYHISKEKFDEMRAYSVSPGDVLISLVGTFGKVAVVPEHVEPGIINPRLIRIRVNQRMILPMFLKHFLELNETQTQLQSLARGQTMGVLNATLLRELTVPVPSLEQQNAFAARVAEIRGIGAEQTASRRRLDDLFQSLLHRAFQGEL